MYTCVWAFGPSSSVENRFYYVADSFVMARYQYVGCCGGYCCLAGAAIGGGADMGRIIGLLAKVCSNKSAYSVFGWLICLYRFVAKLISNLIHRVFYEENQTRFDIKFYRDYRFTD